MGAVTGLGTGLLAWAAFPEAFETCTSGTGSCESDGAAVLSLLYSSTLVGAGAGVLVGALLEPTVGDNRFVASAPWWGAWLGGLFALSLDRPYPQTWRWAFGGYLGGAGLGLALTSVVDLTEASVLVVDGSLVVGGLLGLLIGGAVATKRDEDGEEHLSGTALAASVGIGSAIGLLGGIITIAGADTQDGSNPAAGTAPNVSTSLAPVPGGAVLMASGRM
jgi:hypothetical protein